MDEPKTPRVVALQTFTVHAPQGRGSCKCGWTGADSKFMEHVEAALRAEVIAAGLDWEEGRDG